VATRHPFGKGPFGAGPWPSNPMHDVGGVATLSFTAHAAMALAWGARPAPCGTGSWALQDCVTGVWTPVDGCSPGSWPVTRLPELEPA
jgi:hypothetical protein